MNESSAPCNLSSSLSVALQPQSLRFSASISTITMRTQFPTSFGALDNLTGAPVKPGPRKAGTPYQAYDDA